jgi:hypothetical protein
MHTRTIAGGFSQGHALDSLSELAAHACAEYASGLEAVCGSADMDESSKGTSCVRLQRCDSGKGTHGSGD